MKSRLLAIVIPSAHFLVFLLSAAVAASADVQWYSQSISSSATPGFFEVVFDGAVPEGVHLSVDSEKILVIQHMSRLSQFTLPLTLDQYLKAYQNDWRQRKQGVFGIRATCHIYKKPDANSPKIPAKGLVPLWMAREASGWYSVESPLGEVAYLPQSCLTFGQWKLSSRNAAGIKESGHRVRLVLQLPPGMIQLPLTVKKKGGGDKVVLYNLQVSPQKVDSNIPMSSPPVEPPAKKSSPSTTKVRRAKKPTIIDSVKKSEERTNPTATDPSQKMGSDENGLQRWSLQAGFGFSRHSYSQTIDTVDELTFEKTAMPIFHVEFAMPLSKFMLRARYDHLDATAIVADPYSLKNDRYALSSTELALAYSLWVIRDQPWWAEFILNRTELPFLDLQAGDQIEIRTLAFQAVGARLRGQWEMASLLWTGALGLQTPLGAETGDFSAEDFAAPLIWNLELGIEYFWSPALSVGILSGYRPFEFDYELKKGSALETGVTRSISIPFWVTLNYGF